MDATLATVLAPPPFVPSGPFRIPDSSAGFGGLHGGLAIALVASAIQQTCPELPLRSITGHLHRPLREEMSIKTAVVRAGRSTSTVSAMSSGPGGLCLTASAVLGSGRSDVQPTIATPMPLVPGPESLQPERSLERMIPIMAQLDIRPVGSVTPFARTEQPTMSAWMRVADRVDPVSPEALLFFLDALPPSYTAVIDEPRGVPTVEFAAHLTLTTPVSPWVFVRATTTSVDSGGWVTESIDAWDADSTHLGSARQLRLVSAELLSPA